MNIKIFSMDKNGDTNIRYFLGVESCNFVYGWTKSNLYDILNIE